MVVEWKDIRTHNSHTFESDKKALNMLDLTFSVWALMAKNEVPTKRLCPNLLLSPSLILQKYSDLSQNNIRLSNSHLHSFSESLYLRAYEAYDRRHSLDD